MVKFKIFLNLMGVVVLTVLSCTVVLVVVMVGRGGRWCVNICFM